MDRQLFFDEFCRKRMGDAVVLPKDEFVKEHKKIVKVLRRADPKELKKEAKEQAQELSRQLRKK